MKKNRVWCGREHPRLEVRRQDVCSGSASDVLYRGNISLDLNPEVRCLVFITYIYEYICSTHIYSV